jgi:predicted ATP-grasp superfamily ATP-dependent carboligase
MMSVASPGEFVGAAAAEAAARDTYDILILDGTYKQSLTSARSLGQAGLRVALGESRSQYSPERGAASWRSRYCARAVDLPDYNSDQAAYVEAVLGFVLEHQVRVVLPSGDANIVMLSPHRGRFAELGCRLAVASDSALAIANDKVRTLELADRLGIAYPKSMPLTGPQDLPAVVAELGYPFVVKPTVSWTGESQDRVSPVEVVNEAEAVAALTRYLATGCAVLAQPWLPGRREGVTLLIVDGEVLGMCGAVAHRTVPPLGGVSVMRESIEVPADIREASIGLAKAMGLDGPCEVEWRRDAAGRPMLMEVNARLAGTLENANRSGVDFPLLVWQWATGQPVTSALTYRTGVRTRWLSGELHWLKANLQNPGRPDTMSAPKAIWTIAWEFLRTGHYDYCDRSDIWPALGEILPSGIVAKLRPVKR